MKTLILSLTFCAFVAVAQADDSAKVTKTTSTKAASSEKAKMSCDATAKEKSCCSSCCDKAPQKQALMSPKAAAERRL